MAKAKDLTIQLDVKGSTLTVKSLVDALEKALVLLRTLDAEGEWEVVRVTKQSPVKIVVRNPNAGRIAPSYLSSIRKFDRRSASKKSPPMRVQTLVATQSFADVLSDGFSSIKMSFPGGAPVKFTPRIVANVGRSAQTATKWIYEWTAIRGLLYQITWSKGETRCRIKDALTQNEIPCHVAAALLERVKEALPHRVDLYGRARSNRVQGIAFIDVERIDILPDSSRSMESTPAINITGGMDSAEFIAKVRSGD